MAQATNEKVEFKPIRPFRMDRIGLASQLASQPASQPGALELKNGKWKMEISLIYNNLFTTLLHFITQLYFILFRVLSL